MMKSRSVLAALLACLSLLAPDAVAGGAPREQPRPILRTYVPREEFASLLTRRDKPGRLGRRGRLSCATAASWRATDLERARRPSCLGRARSQRDV